MSGRPSWIAGPNLVVDRRGAEIVLVWAELARRYANGGGVSIPPGWAGQPEDIRWLYEQARLVAEGRTGPASPDSADGTPPVPFRLEVPSSAPVPDLLTTREASALLRCTRRAVVKRIEAGDLPARRFGREWLMTEYDVRHAARNGRRPDASQQAPG